MERRKSSGTLGLERAESGVGRDSNAGALGGSNRGGKASTAKKCLIGSLLLLWALGVLVLLSRSVGRGHASAMPLGSPGGAGAAATTAAATAAAAAASASAAGGGGGGSATRREQQKHKKKRFLRELALVGFAAKHKDFAFLDGLYVKQHKPEAHTLETHPNLDPRRSYYKREGALLAQLPTIYLYYATEAGAWMVGPELGSDTGYAMGEAESANPIDVHAEDGWKVGMGEDWRTVPGVRLLAPCAEHKGCPKRASHERTSGSSDVLLSNYFCASAAYLEEARMVDRQEIDTIVGADSAPHHMCLECHECWNTANGATAHPAIDGVCPTRCNDARKDEL
jgi:hypothetical protein